MALGPRARVLLLAASILLGLTALVWYLSSKPRATPVTPISTPPATTGELNPTPNDAGNANFAAPSTTPTETTENASPTPGASPSAEASASPTSTPSPFVNNATQTSSPPPVSGEGAHATGAAASSLLIPVAGMRPEQLQDTYTQSRSEGRTHNAIDIMAARNTPVVAATDGRIVRLFQSERGGITLYQLGTDERTIYYYAHLERYADGIAENRFLRRGELLGYVGDSGNAGKDNCHLHFSIWLVTDPKRFWDGENVNPYPLLTKR
ncbi:MAG: peptidoglycan LD-endopeptidase LytH [Pyrinomonadaceae bacterium]|jgi:murein DD-endopeptidase MepM/ murein hydrolase activator NlpD|nr:peptidoglycan LD-endopeptidase LytH [Pyrinomonadaceae bacterium]